MLTGQVTRPPVFTRPWIPHLANPYAVPGTWHKGQLHTHSNRSDGKQPPSSVLAAYRAKGYDFICLTDHNQAGAVPGGITNGLLHIVGGEDGDGCRHHTLVVGTHPSRFSGSVDANLNGMHDLGTCPCGNVRPRIQYESFVADLVVVAHPTESHSRSRVHWGCGEGWSLADLTPDGLYYAGIEVHDDLAEAWWDQLIDRRKTAARGFATDDCHDVTKPDGFNHRWIAVKSPQKIGPGVNPSVAQRELMGAIFRGAFYAVVRRPEASAVPDGPADAGPLPEISGGTLGRISVKAIGPATVRFRTPTATVDGTPSSGAVTFTLPGDTPWVRVVVDTPEFHILSQPLFWASPPVVVS